MTINMHPLNVAVKAYKKNTCNFAAENASGLRNKLVILAINTRALNLSQWMLTEDQIIPYSI